MTDHITLRRPDDWHLHLRDGAILRAVLPATAAHFARALVMPNLVPPVATAADAADYRDRIMAAKPLNSKFQPLMTLYLTEATSAKEVRAAAEIGLVTAVKLYPAGATTNSASGVRDLNAVMRVLETMAQIGLPLCVHGEVTDAHVDIFDREKAFLDNVLEPLRARLPELRIVLEHVTTQEGIAWVQAHPPASVGATITVHHLIIDRNFLLAGGIRPHYYCLPVAKRAHHRAALVRAATSGDPRFFLGTDSAPHLDAAKLAPCGCAGIYTAPVALACLAEVFESAAALDALEGFASLHGPAFYRLPPNTDRITLRKVSPYEAGGTAATADGPLTVFDPGFPLTWDVAETAT